MDAVAQPKKNAAALLVGINYIAEPRLRLNGCWNDAISISSLLTSPPYDYEVDNVQVIIDTKLSDVPSTKKVALLHALAELSRKSWAEGLDTAVISFSGHGSQQRDYNGDEEDGLDEGICSSDCMRAGLILDDELSHILTHFNPKTCVYAVFDCCHSGTIVDLPFQFPEPSSPTSASTKTAEALKNGPRVVVMSGCRDEQTSADAYNRTTQKYGGALTMALLKALQMPDGHELGVCQLQARVVSGLQSEGHSQFPLVSSSHPITDDIRMFVT
jgi:hypothetical protein